MMIHYVYCFYILHLSFQFIKVTASIKYYKFEHEFGSTAIFPPCLSKQHISSDDIATILFKSDSGELLAINGKLISENPRLVIKNRTSELIIKALEQSDEGQYECRTDQLINYIINLIIINSSTIRLSVIEGSNVTLQCTERGMWIIEESDRGGPVRTQYTKELILNHVQRDDKRFRKILCSMLDGHEKREYIIDVMYKPTVKLMMSTRQRLMCIICAHPLPHRIQWLWNRRKERDDNIQQTNINHSCIVQHFTFVNENYDMASVIICEAENIYGAERDSLQLKYTTTMTTLRYTMKKSIITSSNQFMTRMIYIKNASLSIYRTLDLLMVMSFLINFSIIDIDYAIRNII